MWSPEIIRARFVEAADTLRRLPSDGGGSGGFWPGYVYTADDMEGWGAARRAEEREMRLKRVRATPAAISRYDEVMKWTADLIPLERHRRTIWAWSQCRMYGSSFRARCDKEGWVPMTEYRRLMRTVDAILLYLDNNGVALRLPGEKWVLQEQPKSTRDSHTLGLGDAANPAPTQKRPTAFIAPGAKATDTLKSPAAIADFTKFLSRTNSRRRFEQRPQPVKPAADAS